MILKIALEQVHAYCTEFENPNKYKECNLNHLHPHLQEITIMYTLMPFFSSPFLYVFGKLLFLHSCLHIKLHSTIFTYIVNISHIIK